MKVTWGRAMPGEGGRRLAGGSARRRGVMAVAAAGVVVVCAGLLPGAGAARAAGAAGAAGISWGTAEGLRGSPAISGSGGSRQLVVLDSVSCWSVNNCAAGGRFYTPRRVTALVVVERNGRWGRAQQLPGMAAGRTAAWVTTVSCAAGGYCVAGGFYGDRDGHWQAFVATLKNGRWQRPLAVRGTKVRHHQAFIDSVSCPSARRCVATGHNDHGAFVSSQVKGVWRAAQPLPGAGGANLSCGSAGNCVAGGSLVASEVRGVWGTAEQVPGIVGGGVSSVSCARDGYCAVGGSADAGAFVATGRNGTWDTAVTWPGVSPVVSVSCPSAGNCAAAGAAWVVSQTGGVWGTPEALVGAVPGIEITSLSCGAAGDCGVGGRYLAVAGGRVGEPFVASETNGSWTALEPVPGITTLNKHSALNFFGVYSVSCPSSGHCTAAGTYLDADKGHLAFVTGP